MAHARRRTIIYWSQEAPNIALVCSYSSYCVPLLACLYLGTKPVEGDTLVWVGFELLLRSRCVGISARRAEWFVCWTETVAGSATIHMGTFEEGLGRIMFVAGALEHERPF